MKSQELWGFYLQKNIGGRNNMKKRILSLILSVAMLATLSTFAVPVAVATNTIPAENRGIGFVNMVSTSPGRGGVDDAHYDWSYQNGNSPFVEFDVTQPGTYTLTLSPWYRSDTMWVDTATKALYLEPKNPTAGVLPVTTSIAINGNTKVVNQPFANGSFWNMVAGTYFSNIVLEKDTYYGQWGENISGFTVLESQVPDINSISPNGIYVDGFRRAGTSELLGSINESDIVTITFTVGNGGTSTAVPPSIIEPAQVPLIRRAVAVGENVTFTVSANGTAPLSYQWQVALDTLGTLIDIPGATGTSYTVTSATQRVTGEDFVIIRCVVTNLRGVALSSYIWVYLCCDKEPCGCNDGKKSGIDYESVKDNNLILTAVTFSFKSGARPTNPADFDTLATATINLTHETLAVPSTHNIEAFSVDGGKTWKAGALPDKGFTRLLNKGGELWLCYKDYNANAKKPQGSGNEHNIIAFPKINQRPKAPRLAVNYLLDADPTGKTAGYWLLVNRADAKNPNPTAQRGADIQIGLVSGKAVDYKGFGQFYTAPNHGIPVLELTGTKPTRTAYVVRLAPKPDGSAFTPASRTARIRVTSEQKRLNLSVRERAAKGDNPATATLRLRANTYTSINGTTPVLHKEKTDLDVLNVTGSIEVWTGATARRPATAKQTITR
jgi:hypothetical protein